MLNNMATFIRAYRMQHYKSNDAKIAYIKRHIKELAQT